MLLQVDISQIPLILSMKFFRSSGRKLLFVVWSSIVALRIHLFECLAKPAQLAAASADGGGVPDSSFEGAPEERKRRMRNEQPPKNYFVLNIFKDRLTQGIC